MRPLEQPRHARDGRAVDGLPRHGREAAGALRHASSTFATHVSHELKSPLTAIQGAAELLRDPVDDGRGRAATRFYDNIVADADRLNRLVRRLIELARAESARPRRRDHVARPRRWRCCRRRQACGHASTEGGEIALPHVRRKMRRSRLPICIDNSARHGATQVCALGDQLRTARSYDRRRPTMATAFRRAIGPASSSRSSPPGAIAAAPAWGLASCWPS